MEAENSEHILYFRKEREIKVENQDPENKNRKKETLFTTISASCLFAYIEQISIASFVLKTNHPFIRSKILYNSVETMKKQITHFSRQDISLLHAEIKSFLEHLKEDYGLAGLSIDSLNFSPYSFTAKISGTVHEHSAFADTWAREESKYFAITHGLPEDILQKTFISNGRHYTITRIETRNPKYPIIASCAEDGKSYKFDVLRVKQILERNA